MRTTRLVLRRPSVGSRGAVLASSVLTAVLLAGCTGEAASTTSSAPSSPASASAQPATSTPSAATSTSASTSTADDGTSGQSTGGKGSSAPAAGGQDASTDGSGGGTSNGGTEGLPGWPIESTPVHGGQFWAAYVAVGAPGDPALQQVLAEVQELWPGAGLGELGCDDGAAAALGHDPAEHAVAVYFPTEQHVTEFRRRWDGPYVGAARVTTFCGD